MTVTKTALAKSLRTIQSYEGYAEQYSRLGEPCPPPNVQGALRRVAGAVGDGGRVLEIGSGPGWEADFLETLGASVRRTDATRRFLELQAERGKQGDLVNVITDDLGGPHDAVVALCVLIHVPRDQIDQVLTRIARALRPQGAFLVSMRDGDGETSGDYHTEYWRRDDFAARMEAAGLALEWDEHSVDCDDDAWNTFLARRA
jgi:2-polyprenyl-3-methyl-5-hydroxy-6-metoxy-1,4-benzoquinol methylase